MVIWSKTAVLTCHDIDTLFDSFFEWKYKMKSRHLGENKATCKQWLLMSPDAIRDRLFHYKWFMYWLNYIENGFGTGLRIGIGLTMGTSFCTGLTTGIGLIMEISYRTGLKIGIGLTIGTGFGTGLYSGLEIDFGVGLTMGGLTRGIDFGKKS
ncbi:unnamed protein product [Sphenostylis stenocarpa]|uniref:Uncharacterized protein n=1 Tax=Sphenostylis stenocarpa TaxID=92480 RepID=A0AA86TBX5_9FABA|nr:unnamed protein product [Sphenostylis stenocarpa]